jgi:hypothetical protein
MELIAVFFFSEVHMKPVSTSCGRNARIFEDKEGGTYSNQWYNV